MPTSTTVNDLKINQLTEAQYDTAVQQGVIGANELSIITDATDKSVQVSTMPTAGADELDNIYQYVGISGTYTNGYFYKCVSDGGNPANYWWEPIPTQETTSFVSKWENYDNIGASAVAIASIVSFSITPEGSSTYAGTESLLEIATTDGNSTLKIKFRFDIGGVGEQEVVEETGAFVGARLYLAEDAPGSYRLIVKKADDSAFVSESTYTMFVYSKYGVTWRENDGWYSTSTVYSTATKFPEKIKLPTTSGLTDGNYALRLTMASGVPTLSWVAE